MLEVELEHFGEGADRRGKITALVRREVGIGLDAAK